MDFIIDTVGDLEPHTTGKTPSKENVIDATLIDQIFSAPIAQNAATSFEQETKPKGSKQMLKTKITNLIEQSKNTDKNINDLLKTSIVLNPNFESLHSVPAYEVGKRKLKEERKKEREKTKGKKWYGLPAMEVTEEIKNDLEVLRMRSALDPKRFYKKNDLKVLPKYFQIGKVMDSPLDHHNDRLKRKERKKTLVDELMADAQFHKYNKRKYREILEEKQKTHYKAWRQAKKLKKRK